MTVAGTAATATATATATESGTNPFYQKVNK